MRPRGTTAWRPLLSGPTREAALARAHEIAQACRQAPRKKPTATSFATEALLEGYLALTGDAEATDARISGLMEGAGEQLGADVHPASLYGGFTGVAWLAQHVEQCLARARGNPPPASDAADAYDDIDALLLDHVSQPAWDGHYDLISGLVGFGAYALERLPRPAARACLEHVVRHLRATARETPDGLTWWTPPELLPKHQRDLMPQGFYNLGVAHGVPGIIAVLGQVYRAGLFRETVLPLLSGAVHWVLSHDRAGVSGLGFPSYLPTPDDRGHHAMRVAWCYGDLGIAVALLSAAEDCGQPAWEAEARRIALRTARVVEPGASGIRDAGLCHGAAGLGHLFNRLFQATGEPALEQAAVHWYEQGVAMHRPGVGFAGYLTAIIKPGEAWRFEPDRSLLTGGPGIALAFLAGATAVEPAWDGLMLASLPPRAAPSP